MRRVLLGMVVLCLFAWAGAQPTGAAMPADMEMLWQVLGSVSAVELDLAGTDVRTVHLVVMFDDGMLLQDHVEIEPDEDTTVTINAGAFNPGLVAWCDRAYVVLWVRHVHAHGGGASSNGACDGGEDVSRIMDFPSDPFGIPSRVLGREFELPLDRWLLLGVSFLEDGGEGFSRTYLREVFAYYVYLTDEPAPPIGARPPLPAYESIEEAERAFEDPR